MPRIVEKSPSEFPESRFCLLRPSKARKSSKSLKNIKMASTKFPLFCSRAIPDFGKLVITRIFCKQTLNHNCFRAVVHYSNNDSNNVKFSCKKPNLLEGNEFVIH